MSNTFKAILLILLLFATAIISACYRLGAVGIIVVFLILALLIYILSPYILRLEEHFCKYNSRGSGAVSETSSKGNKNAKEKIAISSYGPGLIELRLGRGLQVFAEGYYDGQIPVLTAKLRNKMIKNNRFELPPVGLKYDNLLSEYEYKICIRGREVFRSVVTFSTPEFPMDELIINLEQTVLRHLDEFK